MSSVDITIDDENVKLMLKRLAQKPGFKRGLQMAGLHLKGKIAVYPAVNRPTRASVYGQTFKSAAQRKAVMAKLRKEGPYARGISSGSETLGRRWTSKPVRDGMAVIVGNNASYAPVVQGDQQSKYMKAVGWKTAREIFDSERQTLLNIINAAVQDDIKGK